MRHRRRSSRACTFLLVVGIVAALSGGVLAARSIASKSPARGSLGIHKIKHIIVIMQENRSFDSYFGTFPGADGIPNGVCLPDPRNGGCAKPWVDHFDSNENDPHDQAAFQADVAGGKMSGFVAEAD